MVFYRKYRPQKISELDLKAVQERLASILKQKDIPHAFLFTGSKGLGKTSTARILAKAINCASKSGIEPCNKCDICTSITNGSNLDVIEIDAASNRGIDEIRELRERIKFAPASLTKKVYIIDEVHMLTTDAFNALLKTLEEPPSHAVFILCTTELDRVPPTITSRTFHITFQKPVKEEALSSLARVVAGETLEVEEGVLEKILEYSEDSFRDATKILQELSIAAEDKKITHTVLEATYKSENNDTICRLILISLAKKDAKAALENINKLVETGADFKVIVEKMANILHELLLLRNGVIKEGSDIKEIQTEDIGGIISIINMSYRDIKSSVLPQVPLELAVINWTQQGKPIQVEVEAKEIKVEKPVASKEESKKQEAEEVKKEEVLEEKIAKKELETKAEDKVVVTEDTKSEFGMFSRTVLPETFFQALLDRVKRENHSIAGILRGCRLIELADSKAVFEAKYKFHRDKLNEAKTIAILDKSASDLLNREVKVVVEMVAN